MSRSSLKALGLLVAVATTLTGPAPSPATAARAERADLPSAPAVVAVTAKANRPHHFNSSINVDVPAGGTATVTSPSLEADQRSARVEVGATALSDESRSP
jgi:hypothetical protein